ncbi:DUF2357 domain-containing protein [Pontiella agarivorans]|uniref:DUF2357 domain-containing protein n=1 Tax=Pontiella agarivorans TaxID=3038953 RepID=A0ABU5N0W7_9BACT|nr:DUF2357 domain-containing protein [Pontiella agarivorans]MDZ8119986.1 DUF2357 domain-containing protein [Pontiella agarivorans]
MRIEGVKELRKHPWDDRVTADSSTVDGRGSARIVLADMGKEIWLGSLELPKSGFPFLNKGVWYQAYDLPLTSAPGQIEQKKTDMLSVLDIEVTQTNLMPRPRRGKAKEDDSVEVKSRDKWLFWQLLRYFELSHPDDNLGEFEAGYGGAVRRSWDSVRREWIHANSDEPEISLIVRLASNSALVQALDLITQSPRRVLERYRSDTPIGRIQELDSACIRNYAHRPGRNSLEKAGPKQRLYSVLRRENIDTLENRVSLWVLTRMSAMAAEWLDRNSRFSDSHRHTVVKRLMSSLQEWINRPTFCDVDMLLDLPSEPNYPLQFESRYKYIWETYLAIRREDQVFEDAWTWQRVLWGESGRQIFHAFLTGIWSELLVSTPVFRTEGLSGQWLMPFRAPGPFKGPVYLYDSLDVNTVGWSSLWKESEAFPDFDRIGKCGCDQVLWFGGKGIAIWYVLKDPHAISLEEMIRQARESMDRSVSDKDQWVGLVIAADLSVEEKGPQVEQIGIGNSMCVGISIPMDAHRYFEDIEAGIEIALEAAGGCG